LTISYTNTTEMEEQKLTCADTSSDLEFFLLHKFPAVKSLFLKYNNAASAPVERLFMHTDMDNSYRQQSV